MLSATRARVIKALAALAVVACSGWAGWTLATIHVCEAHDACEDAPAVIRTGLAELQGIDPKQWCPPPPARCGHAPAGYPVER